MRRNRQEEPENHERWLVSYADFITLLFAFFVVLYATGQRDIKKAEEVEKSIRKQFTLLMAQVNGQGGKGAGGPGAGAGIMGALNNPKAGPRELGEAVNSFLEGQMSEKERNEAIESLRYDSNGVRMSLSSQNYFKSGGLKIRPEALPALRKIGKVLEVTKRAVVIEGHSISNKRGLGKTARDQGSIRANQILNYFVKEHGVDPATIVTISYGDTRPVVDSKATNSNLKNDRIEILIVTEDLKL